MPTLLVRKSDGTEQEIELDGELIIGRGEGSALVLTEGGVSRKHARLTVNASGQVTIEDLGSSNGTFLDGEKIAGAAPFPAKAELVIGAYTILQKAKAAGARPSSPRQPVARPPAPEPGGPKATMTIARVNAGQKPKAPLARPAAAAPRAAPRPAASATLRGEGAFAGKSFPLSGKRVVGRVAGVDIQIEDDSVSRRHAELEVTSQGVVLRDLGSANGTQVNGEPLQGEVVLATGDSVMFGVTEFVFEAEADAQPQPPASLRSATGRPIPSRRGASASAAAPVEDEEAAAKKKKKKLLVLGSVGVAMVALFGVGAVLKPAAQPAGMTAPSSEAEPTEAAIPGLLAECRSFASHQTAEPQWDKAQQACDKVLDLDPIHSEANQLIRKIRAEKTVAENIKLAERALVRLREEDALELFMKIPADSGYYPRLKPRALALAESVKKAAAEDCKRYLRDGFNQQAFPRCEKYATIACQRMTIEQLYPPLGASLCLSGRCKKDQWKPKDETYGRFLTVRERVTPGAQQWQCPRLDILRPTVSAALATPASGLQKVLEKRLGTRLLVDPVLDYNKGKAPEAVFALQKIRENSAHAQHHSSADQLLRDISNAEQLFKVVGSQLQLQDPEKAAEPLAEGLDYDAKVMSPETLESYPSFFRENAVKEMARVSYQQGVHWMDRSDALKACRYWKLGFKFYRGNPDLNRAIGNVCTQRANQALQTAQNCAGLERALVLAVDGDGLKEKAEAQKAEWKCP